MNFCKISWYDDVLGLAVSRLKNSLSMYRSDYRPIETIVSIIMVEE